MSDERVPSSPALDGLTESEDSKSGHVSRLSRHGTRNVNDHGQDLSHEFQRSQQMGYYNETWPMESNRMRGKVAAQSK